MFLLEPLRWDCVHVPMKPYAFAAADLISCPNPFVIGIPPPFSLASVIRERGGPHDVAVLTLDGEASLSIGRECRVPAAPLHLVQRIEAAVPRCVTARAEEFAGVPEGCTWSLGNPGDRSLNKRAGGGL